MADNAAEKFVERALEEFLQERASGAEVDVEEFVRSRSGGNAARAELLRKAIRTALEALPATILLPAEGAAPARGGVKRIDGRYVVERKLGEGGFGLVYLVRDELHGGAQRALKLLRKELTQDAGIAQRFRNEMVVVKALNHRLLPRFHNDGRTSEGEFYYVMDFVEGEGLDRVLRREGPLKPDRIVRLVRQLLEVLAYAHAKGVFHRDLKPANILLIKPGTEEEEVRVLDFGIAKILTREGEFADFESMHTMEGGAIGTPHYMAPEQVTGRGKVDEKTDLYALGVIIYQMCSGRVPFTGKTGMEIAAARLTQAPPPLEEDTPVWLRSLVMNLLERQQAKRPSTQELQRSIEGLASGQRRLRRSLGFVGAGVAVIALGVAYLLYEPDRSPRDEEPAGTERPLTQRGVGPAAPVQVQLPADGLRTQSPDVDVLVQATGHRTLSINGQPVPVEGGVARTTLTVGADVPAEIIVSTEDGRELDRRTVYVDTKPPTLDVNRPAGVSESAGRWVTNRTELEITGRIDDGEHGALGLEPVQIDGARDLRIDKDGSFRAILEIGEGSQNVDVVGRDAVGLLKTVQQKLVVDRSKPIIRFKHEDWTTEAETLRLEGHVEDETRWTASVRREDVEETQPIELDPAGDFNHMLSLEPGSNSFVVEATDALDQKATVTVIVERKRVSVRVESINPLSGSRFSAAETSASLLAQTNLTVSDVSVTRNGQPVDPSFKPLPDGFQVELLLDWRDNSFTLIPYDEDDVAGEPYQVTYVRVPPPTPSGCKLPQNVEYDPGGRPLRVIHERSGIQLVLVQDGTRNGMEVPAFYIGLTEVTTGELTGWDGDFYSERESQPDFWGAIEADRPKHPAMMIAFKDATAFCTDMGLRLPSVSEWELAAAFRAADAPAPRSRNADDPTDNWLRTSPVGSFELDRRPCGALDMAGNLSEWCTSPEGPELRGGNWSSAPTKGYSDHPRHPPAGKSDYVGLRVALDAPEPDR